MQRYVANLAFDGAKRGEQVEADPALVADWVDAGWLSPVDEDGTRLFPAPVDVDGFDEPVPMPALEGE